ncbi:MAG: hypothetical protein IKE68_04155, partial [Solobacterium sp.]|nr:hypothetical protein [Solobacterium sp.]
MRFDENPPGGLLFQRGLFFNYIGTVKMELAMTDLLTTALMAVQMSGVTLFCVLLTYLLRKKLKDRKLTAAWKISIGLIYGVFCI